MSGEGRSKFNWADYISLAENMLSRYGEEDDDEAIDRCGISRAYYGAFHLTVAYMKSRSIYRDIIGEGSHQTVIKDCISYKSDLDKEIGGLWFSIGIDLKNMRIMRMRADYEDKYWKIPVSPSVRLKSELRKACVMARKIEQNIKKLNEKEI